MAIEPTSPDQPYQVNGVEMTGRQLAAARQDLAHRGAHLPTWAELSPHDQDMAALSAANWLRALTDLADRMWTDASQIEASPAQLGETTTILPRTWHPLDDHGTAVYAYGDQRVDIAFTTADVGDELRDMRHLFDMQQRRMREATARWRAEDPAARELILPDLGDLLQWLMDKADQANSDI